MNNTSFNYGEVESQYKPRINHICVHIYVSYINNWSHFMKRRNGLGLCLKGNGRVASVCVYKMKDLHPG